MDVCSYQSSEDCSSTFSKDKKPKSSHLRCIYTNTYSLGNKQEELLLHAQSESYDIIGTMETWWDNSHDDEWLQTQEDRKGRRGGGGVR